MHSRTGHASPPRPTFAGQTPSTQCRRLLMAWREACLDNPLRRLPFPRDSDRLRPRRLDGVGNSAATNRDKVTRLVKRQPRRRADDTLELPNRQYTAADPWRIRLIVHGIPITRHLKLLPMRQDDVANSVRGCLPRAGGGACDELRNYDRIETPSLREACERAGLFGSQHERWIDRWPLRLGNKIGLSQL